MPAADQTTLQARCDPCGLSLAPALRITRPLSEDPRVVGRRHGGRFANRPHRYRVVANREHALEQIPGGMPVATVRREGQFDIAIRQAPTYRQGCIFLAGDAAHYHSPAGGRGMNLGIADAFSFARRAADDDLEGYSAERHAHGQATIRASESGRRALTAANPFMRPIVRTVIRAVGRMPFLQKRAVREMLDI